MQTHMYIIPKDTFRLSAKFYGITFKYSVSSNLQVLCEEHCERYEVF